MNLDRSLISQLVALTVAKVSATAGSGIIPKIQSAEVVDAGQRPTVIFAGETEAKQVNAGGDPPGPGELCWVLTALGTSTIIGRRAGAQRLLGYATETGTDDFTVQEVLGGLEFEFEVYQPGRVIMLLGSAQFRVGTNGTTVIGEFLYDGVATGRYFRHNFPSTAQAEFGSGHYLIVDAEPGTHVAAMAGTATGGTGTLAGDTTPAWLTVYDMGPVGGAMP